MLSRVADSMFWMSRYIERAENVARFIDVNWHLTLDSSVPEAEQWMALVNATGDHDAFLKTHGAATRQDVIHFLAFDTSNLNSILSCVRAARENARSIRDAISSDMWEQVNGFYLFLTDASTESRAMESLFDFFTQVKLAGHLFTGITDATMSHNEGWNFCRLGRCLERTDKTSRILDVKYFMLTPAELKESAPVEDSQWAAVLKSASALEMYRRRFRHIQPERVVEFLLLDREFPRAALCCLSIAEVALLEIIGGTRGTHRLSVAERRLGQLRSDLSYADVNEILSNGLHEYLDALQNKLNALDDAIYSTFFSMDSNAGTSQKQTQTQG